MTNCKFDYTSYSFGSTAARAAFMTTLCNPAFYPNTTSYTVVPGDHLRLIGSFFAGGTLNLLLPSTLPNGFILFVDSATNNIVLTGTAGALFLTPNNAASSLTLQTNDQTIILTFDGTNWFVIGIVSGAFIGSTGLLTTSQSLTIPPGATQGRVRFGGATGGSGGVSTVQGISGGTGAGGYLEKLLTGLVPGKTLTYTAAAAGAGGGPGGAGGNASAATLSSGTQTIATLTVNGSQGTGGVGSFGTSNPSAAATATGGDINLVGTPGGGGRVYFSTGTTQTTNNANPGPSGGVCFLSFGAPGANGGTQSGFSGNPSQLIVDWYT